jgi:hypothetical protein
MDAAAGAEAKEVVLPAGTRLVRADEAPLMRRAAAGASPLSPRATTGDAAYAREHPRFFLPLVEGHEAALASYTQRSKPWVHSWETVEPLRLLVATSRAGRAALDEVAPDAVRKSLPIVDGAVVRRSDESTIAHDTALVVAAGRLGFDGFFVPLGHRFHSEVGLAAAALHKVRLARPPERHQVAPQLERKKRGRHAVAAPARRRVFADDGDAPRAPPRPDLFGDGDAVAARRAAGRGSGPHADADDDDDAFLAGRAAAGSGGNDDDAFLAGRAAAGSGGDDDDDAFLAGRRASPPSRRRKNGNVGGGARSARRAATRSRRRSR